MPSINFQVLEGGGKKEKKRKISIGENLSLKKLL